VHKSYIVPVDRINGIEGNKLLLKNLVVDLVIGESYKGVLMDIIKDKNDRLLRSFPYAAPSSRQLPEGPKNGTGGHSTRNPVPALLTNLEGLPDARHLFS
jgi:hypothetical protein